MPEEGSDVAKYMTVTRADGSKIGLEELLNRGAAKHEELTDAEKIGRREMREDTTTPRPVYREPSE